MSTMARQLFSSNVNTFLALAAMMMGVVALSTLFFLNQSLRLDEAQSLWQTSRAPFDILRLLAGDVHVPLYHILLHYWRVMFGDTVAIARLLSLFFLVLCIPALYALGKAAYSRKVGLFAALLLSISPFVAWYGSEVRMYTLFTLLVILNQYFFVRIFKHHSKNAWWGYGITALLGIYSHYFFFLSLASQVIFYISWRSLFPAGSLRKFIIVAALVVVTFLPWVLAVYFTGESGNQQPLLTSPTAVNVFNTFSQFLFGFQNTQLNTIFLSLWPMGLLFGFFAIRKGTPTPVTQYFLITVTASVALAFLLSISLKPVFLSRYLIFTIPSLYLLIVSQFSAYPPRVATVFRFIFVGLMLITLAIQVQSAATPVKENYREATQYLSTYVQPQDIVVVSAPFTVYPVEYYYQGVAPLRTLPIWDRYSFGPIPAYSPETLEKDVATLTQDYQQLWLLLSYDQGYESDVKLYFDTRFERTGEQQFSPGLTLYRYKLRYDTDFSEVDSVPAL